MLQLSFILISLAALLLFHYGTGKPKLLSGLFAAWQLIVGGVALAGVFQNHPLLLSPAILLTVLLTAYCFRKIDKHRINPNLLLAIHVLRIAVELVLYRLYLQHKVPQLMTFDGWNFDILVGISAALLLLYVLSTGGRLSRKLLIAWNIAGMLFLAFIVTLAILSAPLPLQQLAFEQPNIALLEFPYCLLPAGIVPIVLMSHLLLLGSARKT